MSFTVVDPKAAVQAANTDKPQTARDRAVAKFMAGASAPAAAATQPPVQAQQNHPPVQNANSVQPEELSAIIASKQVSETTQENTVSTTVSEGQTNTTETPNAATSQGNPPALSAQYAQLARKEKALRVQDKELKAKEAAIAAREAALSQPAKPQFDPNEYIPKSRLKEDLLGTLAEQGYSYDQITQAAMSQPQDAALVAEIKKLSAKVAELESETKGTKTTIEEQSKQQYNQAINHIRNEAKKLAFTNPDFELIKATGSVEDVVSLITKTFEEDGELMSVEEAAQMVEDELNEQITKYAQLSKIQKKLQGAKSSQAQAQQAPAKQAQTQPQPAKTLSNSMTTSKPMTARERALLAFEGKLNKS